VDTDRQIVIDLNQVGASVIRAAKDARIVKMWLSGVAATGDGTIVLRKNAVGGPIVWQHSANVAANTRFVLDVNFDTAGAPRSRTAVIDAVGLYFDALAVAWTAGSVLILYVDEMVS